MASSTERSKRRRAHLKDDHSLCSSECNGTPEPIRPTPPKPKTRGEELVDELETERALSAAEQALVTEIGRSVDRLDKLDQYLADKFLLQFEAASYSTEKTVTVIVKVDRVMAECRQQQDTLRSMVGELRQSAAAGKKPEQAAAPVAKSGGVSNGLLDRIAAKRGQTAG